MSALMTNPRTALADDVDVQSEQRILLVAFQSDDGRRWNAVGGGATVAVAISSARDSCPEGTNWSVAGWNDLYGE
jgi:hypothetical protein